LRRTSLLLYLLVASMLLLVNNVYGSNTPAGASMTDIPAPVVVNASSTATYDSPALESSPVLASSTNLISEFAPEISSDTDNTTYSDPVIIPEPGPEAVDDSDNVTDDDLIIPTIPAFIVAAFDSPNNEEADLVCDGLDDQVEIQAAIDELEANGGGKLIFREGTYYLSPEGDYCLYLPGNLALEGEAEANTDDIRLLLAGEPRRGVFQTRDWSWSLPWVSTDNISFKNLTIDVGSPDGFPDEYPEGNHWQNFFVIAATSNHFLLDNVHFIQDNPKSVVTKLYLHQCDNVIIQDCEFEGTLVYCFHNGRMLGEPDKMLNEGICLFQRNIMRNTSPGAGVNPSICGDMNEFTILDNVFYNSGDTAIDIGISTGALVEGNEIYGARKCGIYSEGGHDIIIRNNYIEDVGYTNPTDPWDGFGIWTADCRHFQYGGNVLIEDNTIRNCGRGIASHGTPGLSIRNNDIQGLDANGISFSFFAEAGVNYGGIPSFADDSEIVNNRIIDFGRNYRWSNGIVLHNVVGIEVTGNLVDGNDNPGAIQGIAEYHSQLCVCPDCGWLLGPDGDGLVCEERTCPECGASLQAWAAQARPNHNIIRNNIVAAVRTPVKVIGAETVVDGIELK
jgi:parallel beta-helix repeat protein